MLTLTLTLTRGHTWFNQNVQEMYGHEQPQFEPITVHFTFQVIAAPEPEP